MSLTTSHSIQGNRDSQEDRFIVEKICADTNNGDGLLMAVMDGHCGSDVADILHKNLVPFFADALVETSGDIFAAFDLIMQELQAITQDFMSGSTLSVAYIPSHQDDDSSYVYTSVIGDSPIIVLAANKHYSFSEEHNVDVNQKDVDFILNKNRDHARSGELSISEGFLCFGLRYLQLTRAFGDKDYEGIIIREPTNERIALDKNSIVIVASDGVLFDENRDGIYKTLLKKAKSGLTAEGLVDWILENEPHDNVTIVLHRMTAAKKKKKRKKKVAT